MTTKKSKAKKQPESQFDNVLTKSFTGKELVQASYKVSHILKGEVSNLIIATVIAGTLNEAEKAKELK